MTNTLRHLLLASAALGLASALVYLYNKTEAVDLGKRNEIVAMLRTLQDVDNRWDVDILRARMEIDENSLAAPDRAAAAQRALRSLAAAAPSVNSPALSGSLGDVTKAINEKASLVDQYKAANGNAKSALRTILAVPVQPASESAPRKADARPKEFQELLGQIAAAAVQYYWNEQDVQRKALEIQAGRLQTLAAGLNTAALREQAAQMDGALKALLAAKPVEQDLYAKVSLLTSGPRLDGLSLSFNRELEVTLEDKERYRVYMIAYAASLLIGIGYLGARLKGANESLERRVAERTRELSEALQHLKESEAQLIQSEKMSSLGQMVAGIRPRHQARRLVHAGVGGIIGNSWRHQLLAVLHRLPRALLQGQFLALPVFGYAHPPFPPPLLGNCLRLRWRPRRCCRSGPRAHPEAEIVDGLE